MKKTRPPRRPGESRDPYPADYRFGPEVEAFYHHQRRGLWIPARVRGACHRAAVCADPLAHLAGTTSRITKRAPVETGARLMKTRRRFGLLVGALLERGAENVAQRRPRIGGAVLRDGLLLFGDFQRLDRDLHLAGLLVELDHPRIDLFADGETLGALIGTLARQLGPLDEGGEVGAGDLDLDAAFLDLEHFAGHDRAHLDVPRLGQRTPLELLAPLGDPRLVPIPIH